MWGWQKWYAVTRPVSSILGCQHPRFSFQIATIVFSNHAQQQTVDNGSVKPAPRIETSHKSFLWTDNKQTHFWSIALFLYRLLWVKNVQYKCIAIETQRTVSFRYWGIELSLFNEECSLKRQFLGCGMSVWAFENIFWGSCSCTYPEKVQRSVL